MDIGMLDTWHMRRERWRVMARQLLLAAGGAMVFVFYGQVSLCAAEIPAGHDTSRIVAVGGTVTEIVYALGAGERLVGIDTSSTYPEVATKLLQVGYQRALSVEGILSLRPSLVLATAEAGPPTVLHQLQTAGTPVLTIPAPYTVEGVQMKIRLVAQALGLPAQGEQLVQALTQDVATASALLQPARAQPRVLFLYTRGQGALQVSGRGTAAEAMVTLADGVNAVTGYEGYKPLTPEAVIAAAPDVLLLPARGLDSVGGIDGLLKAPGVALTPAGQGRRIVTMDDLYLLGFGPRLGQAVHDLAIFLHPALQRDRQ
jgi:iron complex transport system substrate-binding protein